MVLCCGRKKGCPEIAVEDGGFILFDKDQDNEGAVRFDREQATELVKFLQDQLSR